jgi:hypothetical protein
LINSAGLLIYGPSVQLRWSFCFAGMVHYIRTFRDA